MASKPAPSEKDKKRFQRAMQLHKDGQSKEAIRLFDKVRKSWGDDPDIWYLIGLAHGALNEMKDVKRVSLNSLKMNPSHFGSLCNLANAQMALGDMEGALENYQKSLALNPNEPTVLDNYGRALGALGRREEAIEHFNKILKRNQNYAPAHASLARALSEGGYTERSFEEYQKALQLDPRLSEAHEGIGRLYLGLNDFHLAEQHFREAMRLQPSFSYAYIGLGQVQRHRGLLTEALDTLSMAEKIMDDANVIATKADILERMGDKEGAYKLLNMLKERNQLPPLGIEAFSRICQKFNACDEALELISLSMSAPSTNSPEKQMLSYAAGNLLDKQQRYDEAFQWFQLANKTSHIPFNAEKQKQLTNQTIDCFSKEAMTTLPRASTGSQRPIFILGMPRSGTTLTEQILASHPDVYGAGELTYIKNRMNEIRDMLSDSKIITTLDMEKLTETEMTELANNYLKEIGELDNKARYVTDKMPHNFLVIGLINLLFPEARIIHCRRNPLDNCLSIYFQNFSWTHSYATSLNNIGLSYNEYKRLMRHWEQVIDIPMLNIDYEEMVEDTKSVSRRILDFCGLEWDDSVMNFYKTGRAVATASHDQVRQPIYKTSRARWKNYEKYITPLIDALAKD